MATKKKAAKKYTVRVSASMKRLKGDPVTTTMALAFDEWLRRYTKNPEQFQAEFAQVDDLRAGKKANGASAYGNNCAAYLNQLIVEVTTKRLRVRTRVVK